MGSRGILKEYPFRKYHLYNPKSGAVTGIKAVYLEDGHRPTICGEHIVLANVVKDKVQDAKLRDELLGRIDIVYDMGKRMGYRLVEYFQKRTDKGGGWREGY